MRIGLLSFYYLSTGFIDRYVFEAAPPFHLLIHVRSWALSGLALRFGSAIGLHNRSENHAAGAAEKEELTRVWWAHFALEQLLAAMTGHPTLGVNRTCSVPLPLSLTSEDLEDTIVEAQSTSIQRSRAAQAFAPQRRSPDSQYQSSPEVASLSLEPANSGSYLNSLVQLGEITREALSLYAARPVEQTFRDVQEGIGRLTNDLDKWTAVLPNGLNFLKSRAHMPQRYKRERNSLDIHYHATVSLDVQETCKTF